MPMSHFGESGTPNRQNGMMKTQFLFSMGYSTAPCHGFCTKNSRLIVNFRKKSFPFVLAEEGYDVWVGNNRGTVYSDINSHLPDYWEFNVDHFAQYDQPTLINKVL
jgi:hypothetical protein